METCPFYTLENCIEQNYLYKKMIYCQYSIWPMLMLEYHFDVSGRKNRTEKLNINIRFDNLVVVVYLMYKI
jgi:hypothetical protein